jgi:hypothetical protein
MLFTTINDGDRPTGATWTNNYMYSVLQNIVNAINNSKRTVTTGYVDTSLTNANMYVDKDPNHDTAVVNTATALASSTGSFAITAFRQVFGGEIYDYYDSSVDTDKWTLASSGGTTVTDVEDADKVYRNVAQGPSNSTTTITTDTDVTHKNIKTILMTNQGEILCTPYIDLHSNNGASTYSAKVQLYDGSATVDLRAGTTSGDAGIGALPILIKYLSATQVRVYTSSTVYSDVTITSLSGANWVLRAYGQVVNMYANNSSVGWYPIIYADNNTISVNRVFQSNAITPSASTSSGIMLIDWINEDVNATYSMTADGSTFTNIGHKTLGAINAGTSIKYKVTFGTAATTTLPKFSAAGIAWG